MNKEKIVNIIIFVFLLVALTISVQLIFQNYRMDKLLLNGRVLCCQIMNASITYYKNNGKYLVNDKVSINNEYPLDARTNPYFSVFSTYPIDENTQGISVFGTIYGTDYELKVIFNKDDEPKSLKNIEVQTIKYKK
jgi:hypothetical protein